MDERGGELDPLLVAEGEVLDAVARAVGERQRVQDLLGARPRGGTAPPCSRARYTSWSSTRILGYSPRSSGM